MQLSSEVETAFGKYYEVKAVEPVGAGDSFSHRVCHLTYLPLHE